MNVTQLHPPHVTLVDERGVPVEAEIPSRSRPHITYKMRRTGGRWIHLAQPCEAAQYGAECYHKQALEALMKEDYMTTDTVEGEVVGRELAVHAGTGIITADVDAALAAWHDYQRLTRELLDDQTDYQDVGGGKRFKKKSAWRKYANAFKISDHVTFEDVIRDERGRPIWARIRVEAYHEGTGRRAEAGHECHRLERCCGAAEEQECVARGKYHRCCPVGCTGLAHWAHPGDVTETALTRAKNRAISDLIGAGEVSAEEMTEESAKGEEPQGSGLRASAPPQDRSARTPPPPAAAVPQAADASEVPPPAHHGKPMRFWPEEPNRDPNKRPISARYKCVERGCKEDNGYPATVWAAEWADYQSQKAQLASAPGERDDFDADLPYE